MAVKDKPTAVDAGETKSHPPEEGQSLPEKSLPEIHSSVPVNQHLSFWRRFLAFSGPAFLVSVGYMDPGNWATDLAGGSKFAHQLLWVILLANIMAIVFQTLSAKLGLATGLDLAQACRQYYPRLVVYVLWFVCEIAIAACDLAEVLGSAIGLKLLFGIPLIWGVVVTAFDVLLLLALQSYGIRKLEALIIIMVGTIGACFGIELFLSRPEIQPILHGFIPSALNGDALFIAIGIIGATVMPHNLYLHSALVQSRAVEKTPEGIRQAIKYNFIDCLIAMNGAFFVNASILILAASTFYRAGMNEVASIQEAHGLLAPLLGTTLAPFLFALALLAAGQSSTITGTLAGQIVMEGMIHVRLRPWLRRLISRLLAIIPAILVIFWKGESGVDSLLVLSQVILSLQLAFALVPLIHFTRDRRWMGSFATPLWLHVVAWASALLIIFLNLKLVVASILDGFSAPGLHGVFVRFVLCPASAILIPLLVWMILESRWKQFRRVQVPPHVDGSPLFIPRAYKRIAVAVEGTAEDAEVIAHALPLARTFQGELLLINVLESATGKFIGNLANDAETRTHQAFLESFRARIQEQGLNCQFFLEIGPVGTTIAGISEREKADLIITGSHGHSIWSSFLFGSTISDIRASTSIPLFSVRVSGATRVEFVPSSERPDSQAKS